MSVNELVYAARLTDLEVKVLEAGLEVPTYKEAAHTLNMKPETFYTHIQRVKNKIKNAKRFLYRCRRYEKMLFGEKERWET